MGAITMVKGIMVGHAENQEALTGCTVILCDPFAVGGMEVRGGGTSTRQIDSLSSSYHVVDCLHALFLTGGSAFGLDAAGGVMRYLEERGKGFSTSTGPVPIVPTAVIYDLSVGRRDVRPDAAMGYQACLGATAGYVKEGSVGVGCGASVGKLHGISRAMKGGVGTAGLRLKELVVGALVVVNAFGDVVDDKTGKILAGLRNSATGARVVNSARQMRTLVRPMVKRAENTVIGVVATNATLSRPEANHVARMIAGTMGRTISPVHTQFDGDLVFVISLGGLKTDINQVGIAGGEVVAEAVKRAVKKADGFGIIPAWKDTV